jgi:hypothetical protein
MQEEEGGSRCCCCCCAVLEKNGRHRRINDLKHEETGKTLPILECAEEWSDIIPVEEERKRNVFGSRTERRRERHFQFSSCKAMF